jgi:hypothetical protein
MSNSITLDPKRILIVGAGPGLGAGSLAASVAKASLSHSSRAAKRRSPRSWRN